MARRSASERPERRDDGGTPCDATLSEVSAVILAGGLGTRLRSVVADRPKVLAEVDGVPFVVHLLRQLATAGVKHLVLATGHRHDQVAGVVGSSYGPLHIEYSRERAPAARCATPCPCCARPRSSS
jgi:NDP-sugar pyrophosphorylase family protein